MHNHLRGLTSTKYKKLCDPPPITHKSEQKNYWLKTVESSN